MRMAEIKARIPERCPFCLDKRCEFIVRQWEDHYYDAALGLLIENVKGEGVHVFCAQCEEEILEEDVKDAEEM